MQIVETWLARKGRYTVRFFRLDIGEVHDIRGLSAITGLGIETIKQRMYNRGFFDPSVLDPRKKKTGAWSGLSSRPNDHLLDQIPGATDIEQRYIRGCDRVVMDEEYTGLDY